MASRGEVFVQQQLRGLMSEIPAFTPASAMEGFALGGNWNLTWLMTFLSYHGAN